VLAERLRRLGPPHKSLDGAWIVLDREARVGETLLKEKDLEAIRGNQRRPEATIGRQRRFEAIRGPHLLKVAELQVAFGTIPVQLAIHVVVQSMGALAFTA
jgi:hypothetical protein